LQPLQNSHIWTMLLSFDLGFVIRRFSRKKDIWGAPRDVAKTNAHRQMDGAVGTHLLIVRKAEGGKTFREASVAIEHEIVRVERQKRTHLNSSYSISPYRAFHPEALALISSLRSSTCTHNVAADRFGVATNTARSGGFSAPGAGRLFEILEATAAVI